MYSHATSKVRVFPVRIADFSSYQNVAAACEVHPLWLVIASTTSGVFVR